MRVWFRKGNSGASFEHDNETLGFIKNCEFLEKLNDYYLQKDSIYSVIYAAVHAFKQSVFLFTGHTSCNCLLARSECAAPTCRQPD
jgi:hypothetical protein